jgi:hypothetical protein
LKSAREIANRHIGTIERGDDPRYEGCTVEEAVKEWLAIKKGNRSIANERRRFELHVLPTIGTAGVRSVKPEMLSKLLRGMTTGDDPTPVEANRVYTSLRGLFRWCHRNLGCPDDPSALIDKPTKEEPSAVRRREGMEPLLDMTELAQLWNITSTLPGDVLGDLVKSLLLGCPCGAKSGRRSHGRTSRKTSLQTGGGGQRFASWPPGRKGSVRPTSPCPSPLWISSKAAGSSRGEASTSSLRLGETLRSPAGAAAQTLFEPHSDRAQTGRPRRSAHRSRRP